MGALTLEQVSYIAEIIGVVVVVLSLIFLAIEVRQNTNAIKLSTLHDVKEVIREVNLAWAENGDLAEIVYQGFQESSTLTGATRVRFYATMHNLYLGYENLYHQKLAGALDPMHWQGMKQHIIDATSVTGVREYWDARKHWFTQDFQDFIDKEAIPTPPHPSYKSLAT